MASSLQDFAPPITHGPVDAPANSDGRPPHCLCWKKVDRRDILRDVGVRQSGVDACTSGHRENNPHHFSRVPLLTFILRYCGVLVGPHLNCILPFGSCSSRDTKKIQARKDGMMYFDCSSLDRGENYPPEKWGLPKGVSSSRGPLPGSILVFRDPFTFESLSRTCTTWPCY